VYSHYSPRRRIFLPDFRSFFFRHLLGLLVRGTVRHKVSAYSGQHDTKRRGHTSVPQVGLEPTIPAF
jgi:hypothetical protein